MLPTNESSSHQDSETRNEASDPPKKRSRWRTTGLMMLLTMKWLFILGLLGVLAAGGAAYGYVSAIVKDDPVRSKQEMMAKMQENAITGFVYFNDDTVVGQLTTEEDRRLVQWKDIPPRLIDALTSIEDKDFFLHPGISVKGTTRAVKQKLLNEAEQTGGSTLTQQLARRVFLSLDKTEDRKLKEILLSLRMERFMGKQDILVAYLNKVPFGNGSSGYNLYGIKAAAKGIFNVDDLSKLHLAQSAYLVGLPQLPSAYSAFTGKGEFDAEGYDRAVKRMELVLSEMRKDGKITETEYQEALAFNLKASIAPSAQKAYAAYPYLMFEAERQAAKQLMLVQNPNLTLPELSLPEYRDELEDARAHLLRGGYKVYTTIDKTLYKGMRDIARNPDNFSPDSETKGVEQIAAIMLNNNDGAILSMIEGRDYDLENMNYATQMKRQPGSAMKPIAAYLPALDKGTVQPASILDDAPIILKDYSKGFHIPSNSTKKYNGLVTAREALNKSYNLPALKIFLYDIGIKNAWDFTRKLGITTITESDEGAQTGVIGGLSQGVTVEELTNAYATIANKGNFADAYMIRKIEDSKGNVIYTHHNAPEQVVSEQSAFLMTDMLRTVVTDGTARTTLTNNFKHYNKVPIAGKTGTTQNYGDVWFVGYTPDVTLGVWSGYKLQKNRLSKAGEKRAQHIWAKVLDQAIDLKPEWFTTKTFAQPEGIVKFTVSDVSGKLPSPLIKETNHLVTDLFNRRFIPTEEDDVLVNERFITYNGINYIAQEGTPGDFVQERMVVKREKPVYELLVEIKEAQSKLDADDRKPLDQFRPLDSGNDAPSAKDPRKDEGRAPTPPRNLAVSQDGGVAILRFQPSGSGDVVGYRLYRAVNDGSFGRLSGKVVLTGQNLKFVDYITSTNSYRYYVTAVDVAGNESTPSEEISVGQNGNDSSESVGPDSSDALPEGSAEETVPEDGETGGGPNPESGTVPQAPANVKVTGTGTGIHMTWQGSPEANHVDIYNIYFSDKAKGPFNTIGSTDQTSFDYVSVPISGFYRVSAVNIAGESEKSKVVEFKP
ncbi:carboxypeptidase [Paenibacillus swuensis]|uniref:Carboxypeptidase n=1 Tax=Paenibacillus swuensis TaxID=1178515 RepID=A0A172TK58_9BACL|nr:transglycosylase domain-containing protein [Paenibacillus swuensis]ANE47445.1 carboxypeptidase [Paenibacillus swuensis]